MGANAKRVERYNDADWREAACQVQSMIRHRWVVEERCPTCRVRLAADLERIMVDRGPTWSLWGETIPCRAIPCQGEMRYFGRPPQWVECIELTGPPGVTSRQHCEGTERERKKAEASQRRATAKGPDAPGLPAWCQTVADLQVVVQRGGFCRYRCAVCRAEDDVRLDRIIAAKGSTYSLINRTARCRMIAGCEGLVWFMAGRSYSDRLILRTRTLPARRGRPRDADRKS